MNESKPSKLEILAELISDHLCNFDYEFVDVIGTPISHVQPWVEGNFPDELVTCLKDEDKTEYTITISCHTPKRVKTEEQQADAEAKASATGYQCSVMGMTINEVRQAIVDGRPHPGIREFDLDANPVPTEGLYGERFD